ncbi:unnamed protein product [Clavelina lepadiformis]|uniref:Uncharacterized protein n=1 Tax=Clavelina lepadiformis TaxID=159417 RepID=A0ABP0FPC0_CLALP
MESTERSFILYPENSNRFNWTDGRFNPWRIQPRTIQPRTIQSLDDSTHGRFNPRTIQPRTIQHVVIMRIAFSFAQYFYRDSTSLKVPVTSKFTNDDSHRITAPPPFTISFLSGLWTRSPEPEPRSRAFSKELELEPEFFLKFKWSRSRSWSQLFET